MSEYESKAKTKSISATSRASVKVGDSFYTLEYSEERTIPQVKGVDLEMERQLLWDCVNNECDRQIQDVLQMFGKK